MDCSLVCCRVMAEEHKGREGRPSRVVPDVRQVLERFKRGGTSRFVLDDGAPDDMTVQDALLYAATGTFVSDEEGEDVRHALFHVLRVMVQSALPARMWTRQCNRSCQI